MKTITLKQTGYYITGLAIVKPWGGGRAYISMNSFNVKKLKDIKDNINDNGFGVEAILGAICEIYTNYEGHHVYKNEIAIGTVTQKDWDFYYDNN